MITFKSRNIDGAIRDWKFDNANILEDEWNSADADIPANDDPIWDVVIDGKEIYVGPTPESDRPEDQDTAWFEDILTYVGIDIWK